MTDFETQIINELKEMRLDVNHHIKRTDLLEKQWSFLQWVFPIGLTIATGVLSIVLAIIFGSK